jgi:uncharacterized protein YbbC (DUF1343 family)
MEDTGKYIRDRLAAAEITVKHLFTPEHGLTAQEEDHGNTRTKAGDPETIYHSVPNRILRSNQCYWISVYFEATTIEEGRITKDPFCQIGHRNFANRELLIMAGVKFQPYPFYVASGKYKGKLLTGYKLQFSETAENPTRGLRVSALAREEWQRWFHEKVACREAVARCADGDNELPRCAHPGTELRSVAC